MNVSIVNSGLKDRVLKFFFVLSCALALSSFLAAEPVSVQVNTMNKTLQDLNEKIDQAEQVRKEEYNLYMKALIYYVYYLKNKHIHDKYAKERASYVDMYVARRDKYIAAEYALQALISMRLECIVQLDQSLGGDGENIYVHAGDVKNAAVYAVARAKRAARVVGIDID